MNHDSDKIINENYDEAYKAALLIELMRYMKLERDDWNMTDEFDLAIRSVWELQNPLGVPNIDKVDITYARLVKDGDDSYECRCRFTAHPHHNEPLIPSAEDIIIYRHSPYERRFNQHFITDRFNLIKVEEI